MSITDRIDSELGGGEALRARHARDGGRLGAPARLIERLLGQCRRAGPPEDPG
ncbi:hypothetical protein [Egibacter rhizosphaerae]|uniref:hypothetical protein n=1 Tax=Egibacter rhizosphaerae TaxID=1670831 RepID=UPI0013F150FC|nr:hypothetical protein [Egibacter rhizosphaerae]